MNKGWRRDPVVTDCMKLCIMTLCIMSLCIMTLHCASWRCVLILTCASVGLEGAPAPTRRVVTTVAGKNIGYGSTCECLVQAGMVILQVSDSVTWVMMMMMSSEGDGQDAQRWRSLHSRLRLLRDQPDGETHGAGGHLLLGGPGDQVMRGHIHTMQCFYHFLWRQIKLSRSFSKNMNWRKKYSAHGYG